MKKALAILFVLLSLLSFVALNYGIFDLMQLLMLVVFVVLGAFILALRNRNIDALMIVFFCLGLLNSLIVLTRIGLSFELIFYALVNALGLLIPLTGTDVLRPRMVLKPVELPEVKPKEVKEKKKFVASKTGKVYHDARCNWADNIKQENKVWFKTSAQARKAGHKKHKCKLNKV